MIKALYQVIMVLLLILWVWDVGQGMPHGSLFNIMLPIYSTFMYIGDRLVSSIVTEEAEQAKDDSIQPTDL